MPLTTRSVALAVAAIFLGSWSIQRVDLVYGGPSLTNGPLPALPIALLLLLVLVRRLGAGWLQFKEGELLGCYLMTAVGLPLAAGGYTQYLLPGLVTGFFQFSDPSGGYNSFLKLIPDWMVPGREGSDAVEGFFQGRAEVPWAAWALPLMAWAALAIAFLVAMCGCMTLLRKRWLEEERLRLPLAEVPVTLALNGRELLRSKALRAGIAVPALIYGLNGLHHYHLFPAEIPLSFNLADVLTDKPWAALAPFTSRFEFTVTPFLVGIAYLLSVEVAFSTWFFYLLTRAQLLAAELIGRSGDHGVFIGLGGQWREWPNFTPHLHSQARGGLLCLAVLSLWAARKGLADAWRRALCSRGRERWGFFCLSAGSAGLLAWGKAAGLSLPLGTIFVLLLLLTAIGMARLRLDAGLPVISVYFLVPNLLFFAWGTGPGVFSPSEYVAFAFLNLLSYSGIAAVTMLHVEGWKMAGALGSGASHIGAAVAVGMLAGLVCGFWSMLELVYDPGIFSLDRHGGARPAARLGRYYHYLYYEAGTRSAGPDLIRMGAVAVGFAVTAVLSFLRVLFTQLPFHPAGFVYGTGIGYLIWGSALVGWAVKLLVVRYGGAAQYRRLRPFFMGLILGDLLMRLVWAAVSLGGEPGGGYRI